MKNLCKKPKCKKFARNGKEYCLKHLNELEMLKKDWQEDENRN